MLHSTNQMHYLNACTIPGPAKQPGSPSRHGHSPSARLQAARSFFTSSRTAGCTTGHPQAVLQGLVQALHQLPADLNQGQHSNADHWSLPLPVSACTFSAPPSKVCHHDLSAGITNRECFSCHIGHTVAFGTGVCTATHVRTHLVQLLLSVHSQGLRHQSSCCCKHT